jgi:hypothetical protein
MTAFDRLAIRCSQVAQQFAVALDVPALTEPHFEQIFSATFRDTDSLWAVTEGLVTTDEAARALFQLLNVELLAAAGLPLDRPRPVTGEPLLPLLQSELAAAFDEYRRSSESER